MIIDDLEAHTTNLHFFEAGSQVPEPEFRAYKKRFPRASTRFIYWQVDMVHPHSPQRRVDFGIVSVFTKPDGTPLAKPIFDGHIEPGWTTSTHFHGWGFETPGKWDLGTYKLALYAEGQEMISADFEIY